MIRFGPFNQTRAIDDVALLGCEATGDPKPIIRWFKNGKILQEMDPRYTILASGMLQISSKAFFFLNITILSLCI